MSTNLKSRPEPSIHVLEIIGNAIVGGMENYVYNLVHGLPAYGFKVTCLAPYESAYTARLRQLGCDVHVAQMHVDVPWRTLQFTTELIKQNRVDLIHAHLPRAHALAGLAGKLTNRPAAATFHGMELTTEELSLSQLAGTYLITVCQQAYAQALALGVPSDRVGLILNGVDTRLFHPHRSGREFREKNEIPLDCQLVGFVGRVSFEKGPDHFVRMAGKVHEKRPDVHFVVVGEGPMEEEILTLAVENNLSGVFHLAGLGKNMAEIYPAFDLLALTSRIEGMPFALLEGMSCGLPVAAMSVGGVAEIVEVGTNGLTSAAEDWWGLAEAVLKMLAEPEHMKQMGQAGRKRVEEKFDLFDSLQQTTNLFRAMVKLDTPDNSTLPAEWALSRGSREHLPVVKPNLTTGKPGPLSD